MAVLKRSKSITDFFRPLRPRSPYPDAAARLPSPPLPAPPAPTDAYARRDPFSTSTNGAPGPPPIDTASVPRSGTVDDILGAYGDSPTKSRFPIQPERFDSSYTTASTPPSGSSSREDVAAMPVLDHHNDRAQIQQAAAAQSALLGSSQRSGKSRPGQSRTKSNPELDLIDRLDISGLYGGGGFVRHDGPYAAATRKQGSNAPIDAFDPSAFTLANPNPSPAVAAAMRRNLTVGGVPAERSSAPLSASAGPSTSSGPSAARNSAPSKGEVSMGFPGSNGKSQQLLEIYGMQEAEAWEDFGQARYDASAAASRESVVPRGRSKEDRMNRTQSIWDIEATLKAGKPVAQAPPPVPVMPQEWTAPDVSPVNKPKRSKSLALRFRSGRKHGRDGTGGGAEGGGSGDERESYSVPATPVEDRRPGGRDWPLAASMPASAGRPPRRASPDGGASASGGSASGSARDEAVEQLEARTAAIRLGERPLAPPRLQIERPEGAARAPADESTGSPTTGRKEKGGLKRLFSTKRKT
ncbi:uncharacterized protein JCM10292_004589 [Rhodotorula paludigena]|uniref:uncharacterized protein n=1 Tax=Rhodotorula paludigena TaxID=86838 RepID=UPI00317B0C19